VISHPKIGTLICTSISANIERYREKCSFSLSDFSENVAREVERASVDANRAGLEMSTSTRLLDNRDQRVKWKIFEDHDASLRQS